MRTAVQAKSAFRSPPPIVAPSLALSAHLLARRLPAQLTSDVARQVGANRPHAVPALSVRLALSARPRGWERIATDVPLCFALKATPVPATVAAKRVLPMPTTTVVFRYSARKDTHVRVTCAAKRVLPMPTATAACLPYAQTFHVRSTMSANPANRTATFAVAPPRPARLTAIVIAGRVFARARARKGNVRDGPMFVSSIPPAARRPQPWVARVRVEWAVAG
jgi:hypothetical protein